MFGYVKPVHSELLVREHEFYKATYCGICRAMKKYTGVLSNVTLTYDSVFLALVRMLYIKDSEFRAANKRCIAHPLKKRKMLLDNSALEYTARAFAILSYYKMRDDISDEGIGKKIAITPVRPILRHGLRRAKIESVESVVRNKLLEISKLERSGCRSVDEPGHLFGELLGEIFAHGYSGNDRLVLYQCGYHLGKFIYAADAAEDYEDDLKSGKYNPYVILYNGASLTAENKNTIKCALILECKKIESTVNLMPFERRQTIERIVKNIIYLGLVRRISFLDGESSDNPKEKESDKESVT